MQIFKGFIYHLSVIFCFRNFLKNFNFFILVFVYGWEEFSPHTPSRPWRVGFYPPVSRMRTVTNVLLKTN